MKKYLNKIIIINTFLTISFTLINFIILKLFFLNKVEEEFLFSLLLTAILFGLITIIINKILLGSIDNLIIKLKENLKNAVNKKDFTKLKEGDDEFSKIFSYINNLYEKLSEYEYSSKSKLLEERNKSLAIVKSIGDPLVAIDNNYVITLSNKSFEDTFKIKETNILGKTIFDFIENENFSKFLISSFNSSTHKSSEIFDITINNNQYFFNVVISPIRSKNNNRITGAIIIAINITHIKNVEKMRSTFISTISHEFKTPLTSLMIGTSLMLDEQIGSLNNGQREVIKTMEEDIEQLSMLVTNLLQLSKLKNSDVAFSPKSHSIIGIVDSCIKNHIDIATRNDIDLSFEIDENTPKVHCDFEKTTWVLNNLISNSLKFTNAGDSITIKSNIVKGKLVVSVEDTGVGIPKEMISKIFNKFVQVEDSSSEIRGIGLGLSIAKEIVEAQGGEIWCESELDDGSTFYFTLPLSSYKEKVG